MADTRQAAQQICRGLAVFGLVLALASFVAVVVGGIVFANAEPGISLPVEVPLTTEQAWLAMAGGGVGLFVGYLTYLLGNTAASFLAGVREGEHGDGQHTQAGQKQADEGGRTVPVSERYRRKLSTFYRGVGLFVAFVVALGTLAGDPATTSSDGVVGLVFVLGAIATRILFGGVAQGLLVVGVFAALWYGVEQSAREALIAGFVVAGLLVLIGVSAVAVGFVIAGLYLVYYNYMARAATEYQWLDGGSGADGAPP